MGNNYFNWLVSRIEYRKINTGSYSKLLKLMHEISFEWYIERDVNRAADGEYLRREYACETGRKQLDEYDRTDCSVLEMMVALSCRIEQDIMDNPDCGDRTGFWFWSMIENLGLLDMTNSSFNRSNCIAIFREMMAPKQENSQFSDLFCCSTFDLKKWNKMEIWQKMIAWLNENFPF